MMLTLLKAKIHRATVTQADLHYEGSVTIDESLMKEAGILPYEQVDVLNITTGARFTTYAITGEEESGVIGINGAAARLAQPGDLVIICAYIMLDAQTASDYKPQILLMNSENEVVKSS